MFVTFTFTFPLGQRNDIPRSPHLWCNFLSNLKSMYAKVSPLKRTYEHFATQSDPWMHWSSGFTNGIANPPTMLIGNRIIEHFEQAMDCIWGSCCMTCCMVKDSINVGVNILALNLASNTRSAVIISCSIADERTVGVWEGSSRCNPLLGIIILVLQQLIWHLPLVLSLPPLPLFLAHRWQIFFSYPVASETCLEANPLHPLLFDFLVHTVVSNGISSVVQRIFPMHMLVCCFSCLSLSLAHF